MSADKAAKKRKAAAVDEAPAPAAPPAPTDRKKKKDKKKKKKHQQKDSADDAAASANFLVQNGSSSSAKFDTELDAFFSNPLPPPPARTTGESSKTGASASARPTLAAADDESEESDNQDDVGDDEDNGQHEAEDEDGDEEDEPAQEDDEELSSLASDEYNVLYDDEESAEDEDDDDGDGGPDVVDEEQDQDDDDDDEDVDDVDDEDDAEDSSTRLVHETLLQGQDDGADKLRARRQREGDDEPSEIKDRRTVFLGNVPIDAVKSKVMQKALRKHIESFSPVPGLVKASALRFRSVPFSVPTDSMDRDAAGSLKASKQRERGQRYKEAARQLDNEEGRASGKVFLNAKQKRKVAAINQDLNTHAAAVNAYVTIAYPDAALVRKTWSGVAPDVLEASVNAPVLAALVAVGVNGTLFEGRHLRADVVTRMEPADVVSAGLDKLKSPVDGSLLVVGNVHTSGGVDAKRTVFVGNLDFETEEEELRGFFEKLVREERGRPPAIQQVRFVPAHTESKSRGGLLFGTVTEEVEGEWVHDVRLVRDRATQMGKGFGYVRFVDADCVEEVLALHEAEDAYIEALKSGRAIKAPPRKGAPGTAKVKKEGEDDFLSGAAWDTYRRRFKFKSRSLRVSRCKSATASALAGLESRRSDQNPRHAGGKQDARPARGSPHQSRSAGSSTHSGKPTNTAIRASTGRPSSSSKTSTSVPSVAIAAPEYSTLSKEDRLAIKRADPARNARRMEKKLSKKKGAGGGGDEDGPKARVKLNQGKSIKRLGGGSGFKKTKSSTSARSSSARRA
ncbi:hypothetical protein V8E36_003933 [Tilletia maclaganii]